jgi:hypothetical protein
MPYLRMRPYSSVSMLSKKQPAGNSEAAAAPGPHSLCSRRMSDANSRAPVKKRHVSAREATEESYRRTICTLLTLINPDYCTSLPPAACDVAGMVVKGEGKFSTLTNPERHVCLKSGASKQRPKVEAPSFPKARCLLTKHRLTISRSQE